MPDSITLPKAPAVRTGEVSRAPVAAPAVGAPVRQELRRVPARRATATRRVKRALWLVVALALLTAIGLGLRPSPVAVETAAARRGTLLVTVDEDGRTRVKDRFLVSAPLAGTVARITLRAGDSVRQGDPLARLMPLGSPLLDPRSRAEAQAKVAAAQAALQQAATVLDQARAVHGFAVREAERQRALLAAGATAPQAAEQADLAERMRREDLASAEFGRRVAASELRLAQAAVARLGSRSAEHFTIRAPVTGRVLRVLQESEGAVQPGTPLLEIGDPAALEIVVDVLTTDAVGIRPGASVRIERWGGDSALAGHVHRIEPAAFTRLSALGVEEQRVNVIVDLDGDRGAHSELGDGYRVEVAIVVWSGADRLIVPGGGVHRQDDGWAAYVVSMAGEPGCGRSGWAAGTPNRRRSWTASVPANG